MITNIPNKIERKILILTPLIQKLQDLRVDKYSIKEPQLSTEVLQ